MVTTRIATTFPYAREDVWAWHMRPGAVERLTPPFLGEVVDEGGNIANGSRFTFHLRNTPSVVGTWVAEIRNLRPLESFEDIMVKGPLASWVHKRSFEDRAGSTLLTEEITFEMPKGTPKRVTRGVTDLVARMAEYRHQQLGADLAFLASHESPPLRIAVSGARGLIGKELTALFGTMGHTVVPIVRATEPRLGAIAMNPESGWIDEDALAGTDVIVHLAGEPIGKRFTAAHKKRVLTSRTIPTRALAQAAVKTGTVRAFISASAIGYYGATPAGEVNEDSPAGRDFLADVCVAWEQATEPARAAGIRTVNVRTGIVLTPAGGSLPQQLPLFQLGVGGPLARGKAWQSWISIDDIVGIYAHAALDSRVTGPVNGVAPQPALTLELATEIGKVLSRPSMIPVPEVGPQVLLGREGAALLAHASQMVSADKIVSMGYEFRHPDLPAALHYVLGK